VLRKKENSLLFGSCLIYLQDYIEIRERRKRQNADIDEVLKQRGNKNRAHQPARNQTIEKVTEIDN